MAPAKTPAKATADAIVLGFSWHKDTKGTVCYHEDPLPDGSRPIVGALYILKTEITAAKMDNAKHLTVTIEAG